MHTYHIHISGLVQGVGFRPFVCRLAKALDVTGWVSNTNNGVHIECSASPETANRFYKELIHNPPRNAIITNHSFKQRDSTRFSSFTIQQSNCDNKPDLLLTPDIALCDQCKQEIITDNNKRFQYPFTTCLHCGPRYSIITGLPYDRERTTMSSLQMCDSCLDEYDDIENRRHYSQTNSCKDCAIRMHLFSATNTCLSSDEEEIMEMILAELIKGSILAIKGIGGYLLLCDATNESAINILRTRKHRPAKPFALLYADIEMVCLDTTLRAEETNALNDTAAPIVLCKLKPAPASGICKEVIAPGLDKMGIMLPYTPLLFLIAKSFNKPLVATSANISGSPILFKDKDALENLFEVAGFILTYDRDIVTPQDDSVIQFTECGQKIILRRSRGLAPNYFPNPFGPNTNSILAMGSELKSAFAIQDHDKLFISQYLGDQGTIESQTSFKETLHHITRLVKAKPAHILIDKHPGYFVSEYGKQIATTQNCLLTAIQHHRAHFGAVLAENHLLNAKEPVMGFIWDGTGYGDDGQIWGSEVFIYEHYEMKRVAHLDYFPQLLGDKMSREPRLSALSLLTHLPNQQNIIQQLFSKREWQYYRQLLQQPASLSTSSMARFLDGIAAILGICSHNEYEGEAAMQLEALARTCVDKPTGHYPTLLMDNRINWSPFSIALIQDHQQKKSPAFIAWKVFYSLVKMIEQVSNHNQINKIAFSGGVFQNALLNDLLIEFLWDKRHLYFHQQLSPNDECIGFGQLACFSMLNKPTEQMITAKETMPEKQFQFTN